MAACTPHTHQQAYRGRNDDGSESTATWKANENANWTQTVNVIFRLRFEVEESNNCSAMNLSLKVQHNRNGAGWVSTTTTTSVCKLLNSTNVTDDSATTNQLTTSITAFTAGLIDENATVTAITLQNNHTEMEYVLQVVGGDVADADTIQFRVTNNGTILTEYHQTPTATVSKPATVWARENHTKLALMGVGV